MRLKKLAALLAAMALAGVLALSLTGCDKLPGVDAGLAASIFHFGEVDIGNLKRYLTENGVPVRL